MSRQAEGLRYAVRFHVLARVFGQLCLVIAVLTAVPMFACLVYGRYRPAGAYLAAIGVLTAAGWSAVRSGGVGRIQTSEAMVLTAVSFLVAPLTAVVPFILQGMEPVDAVFEIVSGVTTTGLTMLADVGSASPSLLFGRAWMQWYGGLGIVVFSLVLILPSGSVARDMSGMEDVQDDLLGGVKAFARRALSAYGVITGIAVTVLLLVGVAPFQALLYALAAVSTGGFAPHSDSAAALDSAGQLAVILFCLAGALPMLLYIGLWGRARTVGRYAAQAAAVLLSATAVAAILLADRWLSGPGGPPLRALDLPWLALSAQTTAGFSTTAVSQLGPASKISLMAAMFIGGGWGSTAGGVKVLRLMAILRLVQLMVARAQMARHAVLPARFDGRNLDGTEIQKYLLVPLLFAAVVAASWLPFVLYGYPPLDALFDVVSATGTVGLSTGISGAQLPVVLKLVLCGDMLLGRLEIVAWLVVLSPKTWIGRRL